LQRFKPSVTNPDDLLSVREVVERIRVPQDLSKMPTVVLLVSPGRSGSTALLYAASTLMPAYFQPIKNILQFGRPPLNLESESVEVFIKEVFGFWHEAECRMDAVGLLLDAGLPHEKLRVIAMLRDPLTTYESWLENFEGVTLETFSWSYRNTLLQFNKARDLGIRTTAVIYESLASETEAKLDRVWARQGISEATLGGRTDWVALPPSERVILPPEADDPVFRDLFLKRVQARNGFRVVPRKSVSVPTREVRFVETELLPIYRELGQNSLFPTDYR